VNDHFFLPVFLKHPRHAPALVRVDEAVSLEARRYSWVVGNNGRVWRERVSDPEQPGRLFRLNLLDLIAPRPASWLYHFQNQDRLDLRQANIIDGCQPPAMTRGASFVTAGSTFRSTPEYQAALADLTQRLDYHRAVAKSSRARFTVDETVELLEYIRLRCVGEPLRITRQIVQLRWGDFDLSDMALRGLINGTIGHVPGYDYAALAQTRTVGPGRPARDPEQW